MKVYFRFIFIAAAVILFAGDTFANNVRINNLEYVSHTSTDLIFEFDLHWDNSWRDDVNYDAVWIFCKWYSTADNKWKHMLLSETGHSTGSGTPLEIISPSDPAGIFIQRSTDGSGNVNASGIRLVWNFASNGIDDKQAAASHIRVIAIEMVYVPKGKFYAGDGNGSQESSYALHKSDRDNKAVLISSEPVIVSWDSGSEVTVDGDGGLTWGAVPVTNENYPAGYEAFYCMKYEISQGQYCDFLNSLTLAEQNTRTEANLLSSSNASCFAMLPSPGTSSQYRQCIKTGITAPAAGKPWIFGCNLDDDDSLNEDNDGEWIAMNYISWLDILAYADWAGLRPMTELEFEKASRGVGEPVFSEFAWGNTTILPAFPENLEKLGTEDECIKTAYRGDGLCNYYGGAAPAWTGPYRCGFSGTGAATRLQAGATCWGIMDMSGNLSENLVNLQVNQGRNFTGKSGDGTLTAAGNADVSGWPWVNSGTVYGYGQKGGRFNQAALGSRSKISDRNEISDNAPSNRYAARGGRLVRSAP